MAIHEESRQIRFGTCKRDAGRLVPDLARFAGHVQRFLDAHRRYQSWSIEKVAIAPVLDDEKRSNIERQGCRPQDLSDLTAEL